MSDTDEEEATAAPAVELGSGPDVPGEPIARVAARLTWPAKQSDVVAQEGDAVVRTPTGPQQLGEVLAKSEVPLFQSRSKFVAAVETVVGTGPVTTD